VVDGAEEVFGPLDDGGGVSIDPVEVGLEVAVGAGHVSDFDREEDMAAVVGPVEAGFDGLVVGELVEWRGGS